MLAQQGGIAFPLTKGPQGLFIGESAKELHTSTRTEVKANG